MLELGSLALLLTWWIPLDSDDLRGNLKLPKKRKVAADVMLLRGKNKLFSPFLASGGSDSLIIPLWTTEGTDTSQSPLRGVSDSLAVGHALCMYSRRSSVDGALRPVRDLNFAAVPPSEGAELFAGD